MQAALIAWHILIVLLDAVLAHLDFIWLPCLQVVHTVSILLVV
jgi:hypothetical protein